MSAADTQPKRSSNLRLGVVVFAWLAALTGLTIQVWRYKAQPGAQADAPPSWPTTSRVVRDPGRITALLFAHPKCPCTAASLAEFRRLMAAKERVAGRVLFVVPAGSDESWRDNGAWASARSIPGVEVLEDPDGVEAARFGALTSGHVVAYDANGLLVLSGGITTARGHVGEHPFVTRTILGPASADGRASSTPVFGCALTDPK